MIRDIGFVCNENNCVSALIQIFEKRHDFVAGLRIEITGRFIGQNDGWIIYQGPRDRDALPLTAGQLVRLVVQTITEPNFLQHVRGALPALFGIDPGVDKRKLNIPQAVGARKKIKCLKNKSDLAIPNRRQFIVAHR